MPFAPVKAINSSIATGLATLTAVPSVAGFARPIQRLLVSQLAERGLRGQATPSGEVLVTRQGRDRPRVLLLAHHDEVGFLVRHVDGEYAWLDPIGAVKLNGLDSTSVDIHTVDGVVRGVVRFASPSGLASDRKDDTPVDAFVE